MVSRSLVLKVYLYAVGTLVMTFMLALIASRILVSQGAMESIRSVGGDYAKYLAREVAASMRDGQPSQTRLDELSKSLHVVLNYVPRDAGATPSSDGMPYPPAIHHRQWVDEHYPLKGTHIYWVSVEANGSFQGALQVTFTPPTPAGTRPRWIFAGFLMVALGFMIAPPLYFWVVCPLRSMVHTAHRLGADLTTPVTISRKDEFGELEGAFESLRQRIQRMLSQKERLLTDISHELRAPLSRMAIAVPLMREEGSESPYLGHIERNMQTMDRLIGELLTLSRGQTPPEREKESLDLSEIARDLLSERAMVMREQGLTIESSLRGAPVHGDRRLLERALGNLIDNAVKYGAGRLRIETDSDAGEAVFRISDQGPGIPDHELPLLFEPFYRPDTSRSRHTGGTGLGLAIVKAVAQSHGGEATLTSELGIGTTASLRLPRGS